MVNSFVLPPIRCSTISINQENYITYDENMVWGVLNFLDSVADTAGIVSYDAAVITAAA
jgi:hypothetical protein